MCNGYFLQGKICYRTGKVMARRHGKSEIGWLAHWQFVNLAKDTIPIKIIISSLREERCPLSISPWAPSYIVSRTPPLCFSSSSLPPPLHEQQ